MKITLLGHRDIASLYSLNRIMQAAPEHQYSIFHSGELRSGEETPEALQRLATIDLKLCEEFLQFDSTSPLLGNAPALAKPNEADGLDSLGATRPDLIVSVRYRRILKEPVIAIAPCGVLNLHSGILPDYRGVMATFWAMLNDEVEIGTTLHRIVDAGIDTGPIIQISRQPTRSEDTYLANVLGLYGAGCHAIHGAIESLSCGTDPKCRSQAVGAGKYFHAPEKADLDRFSARGLRLAGGLELETPGLSFLYN